MTSSWVSPIGHADIAPSRFERVENDGYHTVDSFWVVPALLGAVPVAGRVLEPAAGRGHLSLELRRAGLDVTSFDIRAYANPLVPDIGAGDIRKLESLSEYDWVVTNLPYGSLTELAEILVKLGIRDRCNVALLVRHEWIVARDRRNLIHNHPWFAGQLVLTARPRWFEEKGKSPRHNFCWLVWSATLREGDPWLRFAGKAL